MSISSLSGTDEVRGDAPAVSWGSETRALFVLAWPLVATQLAQNALFLTDVIMMGWLGPETLAAGTLAAAFINMFLIAGMGLVGTVAPLVAQSIGAGKLRDVRRFVRQGFWVACTLFVLLLPLLWNVEPVLLALGQDPLLSALARDFAQIGLFSVLPALGIVVLRSFLAAQGATRVILLITIAGVLVNIGLNYLLVFGNFGFPRLELRGSAISTLLVNVAMFALMLAYVLRHRRFRRYHILARFWETDWSRYGLLLRLGVPIGLTVLAETALFSSAAVLMGWLGSDELAAHAVALQLAAMSFMVPLGLSQATTVRVGLSYGRRSIEGIEKAGWTSIAMTVGVMALSCTLFLSMPLALVSLFLDPRQAANAAALTLAASYLGIAGLFQLADGTQVVASAALRGLSDTKAPMFLALFGYWAVGFPVAYLLGFTLDLRGIGIWLGLASGLAFAAIVLTIRFAMRERLGLLPKPAPKADPDASAGDR